MHTYLFYASFRTGKNWTASIGWKYFWKYCRKKVGKSNFHSFVQFHSMEMFSVLWKYSGNITSTLWNVQLFQCRPLKWHLLPAILLTRFHLFQSITDREKELFCAIQFRLYSCRQNSGTECVGLSDLVDLWVTTIKKPMILCARSASRSREQSTKRRSHSENTREVCLFYSQNNKLLWLSNMSDTFFEKCTRCAKVWGLFSWLYFSDPDWLDRQPPITSTRLSTLLVYRIF